LLSVLAAQGETPIGQDKVADQLWPDADGDAARNSLDNALHRLRKVLGGDDRIVLRHGALSLNPTRCWTDVRATERLVQQVETAETSNLPALIGELGKAYGAPLLPDGVLASITSRRRTLHAQVQRTLSLAATRLDEAGMPDAAQLARESLPDFQLG
jgi:DNA-binding SARP family transcriptional activator